MNIGTLYFKCAYLLSLWRYQLSNYIKKYLTILIELNQSLYLLTNKFTRIISIMYTHEVSIVDRLQTINTI